MVLYVCLAPLDDYSRRVSPQNLWPQISVSRVAVFKRPGPTRSTTQQTHTRHPAGSGHPGDTPPISTLGERILENVGHAPVQLLPSSALRSSLKIRVA